jgi:UDP-hydrolysing UDP-N-acetyl-D-glucosamine 2-epimerase
LRNQDVKIEVALSSAFLLNQYGNAHQDVLNDGFSTQFKIDCLLSNDSLESMSKTVGLSLIEHSTMYAFAEPDAVLVTGDRFDILGAVLSARMMNIPIFHIQGGEITGSIDDTVRDLITICSSRHYTATDAASRRVADLVGSENVYNFGCPAVEMISRIDVNDALDEMKKSLSISPDDRYLLIALHPNTESANDIDMNKILDACLSFDMRCVVFHPNPDAFNGPILRTIKDRSDDIKLVRHLPVSVFVKAMAHCSCMVGNSSAGIREAASFGTPVVNIGERQRSRERNKNTIDVPCDTDSIKEAIRISLQVVRYPKRNIYFKENASKNIALDVIRCLQERRHEEKEQI